MKSLFIDTGPLVALIDRRDRHHTWAREFFDGVEPPLFSCEPVVSEACYLLGGVGGDAILGLLNRRILQIRFHISAEVDALRALMSKFVDVPISLADACLVRMTELDDDGTVVTLDSDFSIYRRNRRQLVPTIKPS